MPKRALFADGVYRLRITGLVILIMCGLFVFYVEGIHWIAAWNLFPLFVAAPIFYRSTGDGSLKWPGLAFFTLVSLSVVWVHAAWWFDWDELATGSSTSGLIFLLSPVYSLFLGGLGWGIAKGVETLIGIRNDGSDSREF